jgi:hypothetical protein
MTTMMDVNLDAAAIQDFSGGLCAVRYSAQGMWATTRPARSGMA